MGRERSREARPATERLGVCVWILVGRVGGFANQDGVRFAAS